jgi:N6-adenosine-specific RNA methylase IME4
VSLCNVSRFSDPDALTTRRLSSAPFEMVLFEMVALPVSPQKQLSGIVYLWVCKPIMSDWYIAVLFVNKKY